MRNKYWFTPPPAEDSGVDVEWDGSERRSGDDRRKRRQRHPHHIDWRHGFDRRKIYPITGRLRDHRGVLISLLVLFNLLSLVDGLYTGFELASHKVTEANPVFAYLIASDPVYAGFLKIAVIFILSLVIWFMRKRRIFLQLLLFLLGFYGLLFLYHLLVLNLIF